MSGGGGGKGPSQESSASTQIDPRLAEYGDQTLGFAQQVAQLGYQPNRNVQVAAFTPMQEAAFQNQNNAMGAFGMAAPSDPMAGMPATQTSGSGIQGYSFAPEYDAAMAQLPEGYRNAIQNMFIDPMTGQMANQQAEPEPEQASSGKGGNNLSQRDKDRSALHLFDGAGK